jgi:hypothetical protein
LELEAVPGVEPEVVEGVVQMVVMAVKALILEVAVLLGLLKAAVETWMLGVLESTAEAYGELQLGVHLGQNPR